MSTSLAGKNALVTGGTRGIGRAISLALAAAGANVVTNYRGDVEAAENLAVELKETGGTHHVLKADITRAEAVTELVETCRERLGSLDVVVHNAGLISHVPFGKLTDDAWSQVVDSNLTAAYRVTQQALPLLGEQASVIYVGSKVATVGVPLRAHYTAAKAGLVGLARSLAKELGPKGVRVNIVAPGIIDTSDPDRLPPQEYEAMQGRLADYKKRIPLGRLGRAEDIARAVLFLAGPDAAFITGETLNVDGGM
ncbi:short-chain dehydrogenase [Sphaerisporangium rufum]|uniref:Short-chain dehydrogenase n=1 Tax=Sphaerisporangium rufum TaxID=1381558 RepID=A0A919RBM4_9ACTN|nr:3-oxoacyl-ACP reductase family protein [Sphaerisporangium rufum]GII80975.1 short-chain dehydrogenase [Sphaerisporangium rufum]